MAERIGRGQTEEDIKSSNKATQMKKYRLIVPVKSHIDVTVIARDTDEAIETGIEKAKADNPTVAWAVDKDARINIIEISEPDYCDDCGDIIDNDYVETVKGQRLCCACDTKRLIKEQ